MVFNESMRFAVIVALVSAAVCMVADKGLNNIQPNKKEKDLATAKPFIE